MDDHELKELWIMATDFSWYFMIVSCIFLPVYHVNDGQHVLDRLYKQYRGPWSLPTITSQGMDEHPNKWVSTFSMGTGALDPNRHIPAWNRVFWVWIHGPAKTFDAHSSRIVALGRHPCELASCLVASTHVIVLASVQATCSRSEVACVPGMQRRLSSVNLRLCSGHQPISKCLGSRLREYPLVN